MPLLEAQGYVRPFPRRQVRCDIDAEQIVNPLACTLDVPE